jgi:hypothetical protein
MLETDRKFLRYIVRWRTEHDKTESGAAQIRVIGYCVYDRKDCKTLFEHADRQVCEKVLEMMLNDER